MKSREPSPTQTYMVSRGTEAIAWQQPDTTQVPDSRRSVGVEADHSRQFSGAAATPSGRGAAPFGDASVPSFNTLTARHSVLQSQRGVRHHQEPHLSTSATAQPRRGPNPGVGGRSGWHSGEEDGSDWEGSDAEAYIDFQRVAKSFRTWRSNAFVIRESRCVMEHDTIFPVAYWSTSEQFLLSCHATNAEKLERLRSRTGG